MRKMLSILMLLSVAGCGKSDLEMQMHELKDKAMELVGQGFSQGAQTTQFQAGLQGINPGYEFDGEFFFGTCVKVHGIVRLNGVSGQIQAASQAGSSAAQPSDK